MISFVHPEFGMLQITLVRTDAGYDSGAPYVSSGSLPLRLPSAVPHSKTDVDKIRRCTI